MHPGHFSEEKSDADEDVILLLYIFLFLRTNWLFQILDFDLDHSPSQDANHNMNNEDIYHNAWHNHHSPSGSPHWHRTESSDTEGSQRQESWRPRVEGVEDEEGYSMGNKSGSDEDKNGDMLEKYKDEDSMGWAWVYMQ